MDKTSVTTEESKTSSRFEQKKEVKENNHT